MWFLKIGLSNESSKCLLKLLKVELLDYVSTSKVKLKVIKKRLDCSNLQITHLQNLVKSLSEGHRRECSGAVLLKLSATLYL